jgi:hypothetical protein
MKIDSAGSAPSFDQMVLSKLAVLLAGLARLAPSSVGGG